MLQEIKSRKKIDEHHRRWFESEDLELIVWYNPEEESEITDFEICYGINGDEHALRFGRNGVLAHSSIDGGSENPMSNRTPIHVPNGAIDKSAITELFCKEAGSLEDSLRNYILNKLESI